MKQIGSLLIALMLVLGLFGPANAATNTLVTPTIAIVSVDAGKTVTIKTANYPANDTFNVYMNTFGTRGVGGTLVTSVSSGTGGAQTFTFTIPDKYKNEQLVAIRLESPTSGYYSYNWFYNQPGVPATGGPLPAGTIPTISISSVDAGKTVTIKTNNFPANDTFDVLMGKFGTMAIGGTKVTSVSSGTGGAQTFTFNIPDALKSEKQIAIRLQSPTSGYYSYNWFTNQATPVVTPGVPSTGTGGPYPTIAIDSVVKDSTVTIVTKNFPANDTFTVTMGKFGTMGVGGASVTSVSSGSGGTLTFTFTIPASLKGESRIAIRLQSPTSGYYSYNWFYNN